MTLVKDNAPPVGARLRLNMTPQDIDALPIPDWKRKIVRAMRDYGAFVGDTCTDFYFAIEMESGNQYTRMSNDNINYGNKWTDFADANKTNGWRHKVRTDDLSYPYDHWVSSMHLVGNPDEGTTYKGETFDWKKHVWSNLVVVAECASLPYPAKRCI